MNIGVLLCGILDPKWPLPQDDECLLRHAALDTIPRKLSPFDEAALEVALTLRDAVPGSTLAAYMPEFAGAESLMRAVAAHKPERVAVLAVEPTTRWDATAFAQQVMACMPADVTETLWLIGREFGDLDDGAFSACAAHVAGVSLIAMAEALQIDAHGTLRAVRTRSDVTEFVRVPQACMVTITNAKSNRLRHPLMKNVMLAKKLPVVRLTGSDPVVATARVLPVQRLQVPGATGDKSALIPASAGINAQVEAVFELLCTACPT
jgi:electron transfer flavoprotein beta subunit